MNINSLALSLLSYLTGCGYTAPPDIRPREPNVISLDPQDWYIFYSAGLAPHPSPDSEGAWSFQFPSSETGGHVNYVQTPFNATTTPQSLTITFKVESDAPQYVVLDPGDHPPATFHLFFEQRNDDLKDPNGRWWADSSPVIYYLGSQDGQTLTFVAPLTPDIWGNVVGEKDPQAFSVALANIGWIGVTFGGQFFAGHGVALSGGSAKFILVNFSVD
ncbi:MAG TPA: hypothetical protein VKR82_04695 [Candidatus Acidoferrales bacterium]|nr:hypothetical protein [Candidatus Acidoferrales bacterium]